MDLREIPLQCERLVSRVTRWRGGGGWGDGGGGEEGGGGGG